MKILIVNIYFHPDPTGTGLVMTELARDLAAQGHEVTVVTSIPHYGGPKGKETRGETLDGVRVIRTAVYIPRRLTFGTRTLNYLSFCLQALWAGLRCGTHDVILCASPPLPLGASVWLLSRLKRAPFVFNVQDIYPDCAVLMGVMQNPALLAFCRYLEKFIYRQAALVTVISESAKQNLLAKGVPDAKIAVIPNWADVDHIRPLPADNDFRRALQGRSGVQAFRRSGGDEDAAAPADPERLNARTPERPNKIVMFAGNIGLIAGLETVLEAAAELRGRADIHFMIVGEGTAKMGLVARAQEMGLPNVTSLPTQPREILPEVLAAADVHLVTLKRRMSSTSVPSKSYGIMAGGRPMVAAVDPGSEVWRLVEAAEAGICVPPEQPSRLARAILSLCDAPERRRILGENARAYVVRHHAKHELTALYERTLTAVARKEGLGVRGQGSGLNRSGSSLTPDP